MMPPGGVEARAKQIATLVGLARDIATGDAMLRAIEKARRSEEADPDGLRAKAVEEAARQVGILARIPAKLVAEAAELKTNAQAAWARARTDNDFAGFAPLLERTLELQRETAMAIGYADHPYDALVSTYEPDMTWARLQPLYGALKAALVPLNDAARDLPPIRMDFLERPYPVDRQRAFALSMARRMGYDVDRGRLDDTLHPFEISFTRADVRITGRFRETWLRESQVSRLTAQRTSLTLAISASKALKLIAVPRLNRLRPLPGQEQQLRGHRDGRPRGGLGRAA
jgi:carboxypeptidase Taq